MVLTQYLDKSMPTPDSITILILNDSTLLINIKKKFT